MLQRLTKSIINSLVLLISIAIIFWILNKFEVGTRGIENITKNSKYSNFSFVNFFELEVFNLGLSLLIIILIIYIVLSLFFPKKKVD
ncbi:hypothetical protein [Staphylococcus simulans]|uniref:hypothetical protein n=1 Tax=Staphylococcus simulans TaxID=1286 RepID=UPI000D1D6EBC|nr:hypothetical protein [Staphylococcus simulans]PTJ88931.1 hypothetical protein BU032_12705 [Staphylococcus simulans]